jgi:hypothetical protein
MGNSNNSDNMAYVPDTAKGLIYIISLNKSKPREEILVSFSRPNPL